jgi:hypothetical protein
MVLPEEPQSYEENLMNAATLTVNAFDHITVLS